MTNSSPIETKLNAVIVEKNGDKWIVRVIENGAEIAQTYEIEAYAKSMAAGQKLRLNLRN